MHNAQLFLHPQFQPHKEHAVCFVLFMSSSQLLFRHQCVPFKERDCDSVIHLLILTLLCIRKLTLYSTASFLDCLDILRANINLNYRTGANLCYVA